MLTNGGSVRNECGPLCRQPRVAMVSGGGDPLHGLGRGCLAIVQVFLSAGVSISIFKSEYRLTK